MTVSINRGRWRRVLAATVVASGVALFAPMGQPAAMAVDDGDVRMMPLGDSITAGRAGGYRNKLEELLAGAGYSVDFVGSLNSGPPAMADGDHEGHSGWRIDQLDAKIVGWLRDSKPQTVLLHIGTNDIGQNYRLNEAKDRLSALIDKITANAPDANVFVGTLIPGVSEGNPENAEAKDVARANETRKFNGHIRDIVREKSDAGRRVHLVDMKDVKPADLSDRTHPTLAGYDKMAHTWNAALTSVPGSLIGRWKPARLVNPATDKCLDVAGVSTVPGTRVVAYPCTGGRNQSWTATAKGELRVYGDRCLEAASTASGAQARIALCTGSRLQQWTVREDSSVLNVGANRCLDMEQSQAAYPARKMQLRDCNSTVAQRWVRR